MTLGALAAIYFVQLAAAISPGPAILMAARTGLREGFARGVWLSLGIGLGAAFWALAALFGLSVLFRIAPALLTALKFAGAAYLLWMAVKMWRHAPDPIDETDAKTAGRSDAGLFRLGLAIQLANPKPAIFFGTVFLTFLPPDAPGWAYPAILLMVLVNDSACAMLVAGIFSLERTRRAYVGLKTAFERVFGGLLALLGLKLALT
ncbi:LysE family translocator [Sinirhodobacter populi]|uniref:LysE family translocator n=1 Tax=Paenirhodobacter populi TaxID=2306993 RepID=A0A443K8E1_9RHOB|nr:LysE family translocator [Sinirhodobacter populi]RWR28982.1 LysE family translocator [Sinirhodobacter populi]